MHQERKNLFFLEQEKIHENWVKNETKKISAKFKGT